RAGAPMNDDERKELRERADLFGGNDHPTITFTGTRAERDDYLRVPRDRDLHGAAGDARLLRSPGSPRGLRDRRLGIAVRLVRARNPVLDRLRLPAPAAGPEPGREAQSVNEPRERLLALAADSSGERG